MAISAGSEVASSLPTLDDRSETLAERENRNLNDLLQELRVAGLGVQVLFGFLLSLPFTVRFTQLDAAQQGLYEATLLCAALSTALLISPVAFLELHRDKLDCLSAGGGHERHLRSPVVRCADIRATRVGRKDARMMGRSLPLPAS